MSTKRISNIALPLLAITLVLTAPARGQDGPYVRLSLGPGVMMEFNSIDGTGFTMVTKNHAIGWGFEDRYAVSFSEFGAFVRKDVGPTYRYINLDAYGVGFSYRTETDWNFHVSAAYGTVHFADTWTKQGDFIEDGYAVSFAIDKKWMLSRRIDLGVGPHTFLLKTPNYTFTNLSVNIWLDLYLFPQN